MPQCEIIAIANKKGGVLLTLVDSRTNLSKATSQQLQENYESVVKIFDTQIPRATKVAESTFSGKSIFAYVLISNLL